MSKKKSIFFSLYSIFILSSICVAILSFLLQKSFSQVFSQHTTLSSIEHSGRLGQPLLVDTLWTITLVHVTETQGPELLQVSSTQTILLLTIRLKNNSQHTVLCSTTLMFSLHGKNGNLYTQSLYRENQIELDGIIKSHQVIQGIISYVVPRSLHAFILLYAMTSKQTYVWNISIK